MKNLKTTLAGMLFAIGTFDCRGHCQCETWNAIGDPNGFVYCLGSYKGELVAGGSFFTHPGGPDYIARWDGSDWQPLDLVLNFYVLACTVYNDELIAGGYFNTGDPLYLAHICLLYTSPS